MAKKRKKPGPPKLYDFGTVAVRITKEQGRELRLVRATLGRTAEDSDAIRYLLDQSACARRLKISAGVPSW